MSTRADFFPEIEGTLEERRPEELIELVVEGRLSGILEAHDGPRRWELVLRGGDIISVETTVEGDEELEVFYELEQGRYRLRQQLLLPDGSRSDRFVETGELADADPIALVRCCEEGGLTGTLRLRELGRVAEALFDRGELTTITLDGHQDVDVDDLWRWQDGQWAILARPALDAAPNPLDSGLAFLKEIEVAACDFLAEAEASRRDDSEETTQPRRHRRSGQTVKVVYLDTVDPYEDTVPVSSRYAKTDITAVVVYSRSKGGRTGPADSPISIPTVGDPVRMALAPATAKKKEETEKRVSEVETRPDHETPWALIVVTVVLLSVIAVILWLLSSDIIPAR